MSKYEPDQNVDYDDVLETIYESAQELGMSDDDIWIAWKVGVVRMSNPAELAAALRRELSPEDLTEMVRELCKEMEIDY